MLLASACSLSSTIDLPDERPPRGPLALTSEWEAVALTVPRSAVLPAVPRDPQKVVRTWPSDWPSLVPFGSPSASGGQDMGATVAVDVDGDPFAGIDDETEGEPMDELGRALTPEEQIQAIDRVLSNGGGGEDPGDSDTDPALDEGDHGEYWLDDGWRWLGPRERLSIVDRILREGDQVDDPRDAGDSFEVLIEIVEGPGVYDDDWRPLTQQEQLDMIERIVADGSAGEGDDPRDDDFEVPIEIVEGPGVYDDDWRPLTPQEQLDMMNRIVLQGVDSDAEPPAEDLDLPEVPVGTTATDVDEDDLFAGIGEHTSEPLDEWMTLTAEQRRQAIEDALRIEDAKDEPLPSPTDQSRDLVDRLLQGQGIEGFDGMTFEEKVAVLQERLGQAGENPFEGLFDEPGSADVPGMTFEQRLKAIEDVLGIRLDASGTGTTVDGVAIQEGNAAFNAWLRGALRDRLAGVEGERDADGVLVLNDITIQALDGAFLIQDAVVAQLHTFAARLQAMQKLDDAQRLAMAKDLVQDAGALNDAYVNMIASTPNPYWNRYNKRAQETFQYRQQEFFSLLDRNPILGIKRDKWLRWDEAFLFQEIFHKIQNTQHASPAARDQALLAIFDEFLQVGIDNSMDLAKTEGEKKELEDVLGFGGPKYKPVQDRLIQGADALDQRYIKGLIEAARGEANIHLEIDESQELWARILIYSAVAGTSLILPGTSGLVFAVVFSGAEVAYEGAQLVRVELEAGEAERLAVIGGFEHLGPMYEQMVGDQWSNFSLAVLFGLADVTVIAKVKKALAQRRAIREYADQGARNLMPNGTPAQQKALADRIEQSLLKAPRLRDATRTTGRAADEPSSGALSSADETLDLDPPSGAVSRSDDAADDFDPVGELPDQPPAGVRQAAREGQGIPENLDPLGEFGDDAPPVLFREFAREAARRFLPDGTAAEQVELAQRIEERLRRAQRGRDATGQAGRQADEGVEDETLRDAVPEEDTVRDVVPEEDTLRDGVVGEDEFGGATLLENPSIVRQRLEHQASVELRQAITEELLTQIRLARRANVPETTFDDLLGGFDPEEYAKIMPGSALRVAERLAIERLRHQGYQIFEFVEDGTYWHEFKEFTRYVLPDDEAARALWNEALQVRGMFVRARTATGLSPEDVAWLQERIAANPDYFRSLTRRGFAKFGSDDIFQPVLNGKEAWQLRRALQRATAPQDQVARLLTQEEYASLLARQSAGETLDLSNVPRPGIARVIDGEILIAQGAGRHDRARPDDLLEVFIRSNEPLPEGIEIQILEEGVSPELVRTANLLSARGPQRTNPGVVNAVTAGETPYRRVRVRARDARTLTSDIQTETRTLLEQLRAAGVDTAALEARTASMSPVERLAEVREEAQRLGIGGAGAAGVGAGGAASSIDPGRDQTALGGPSGSGGEDAELEVLVVSNGGSTGDVLEMVIFNHGKPERLEGEFALEPVDESELTPEERARIEEMRNAASGDDVGLLPTAWGDHPSMPVRLDLPAGVTRVTLEAYCLQYDEAVPAAGTIFRIANPAAQEAYAASMDIMRAARQVRDAGGLEPDSDPTDYYHSIAQWAIWAHEKDLDEPGFVESFVEHGRRNFEAAGREWTSEVDELAREIAPRRWLDVTQVLAQAERN